MAPLDSGLLEAIKGFLGERGIRGYREQLSVCADDGQLYASMPLPFTDEAVQRGAARIRIVQEVRARPLLIESASAYVRLPGELDEAAFIRAVLDEADCRPLLDLTTCSIASRMPWTLPVASTLSARALRRKTG